MSKLFYKYHETEADNGKGETKALKISADYVKGQGIKLYVQNVELLKRDGYIMESFSPYADCNYQMLVKSMARKSQKVEAEYVDKLEKAYPDILNLTLQGKKYDILNLVQSL